MAVHTLRIWNKLVEFDIGAIYRRRETFKIPNFYEALPSYSNCSYILGNSFSFYPDYIVDEFQFNRSSRGLFVFALRGNLVRYFDILPCFHVSCCLQAQL